MCHHATGNEIPAPARPGHHRLPLRRVAGLLARGLDQRSAGVPGDGCARRHGIDRASSRGEASYAIQASGPLRRALAAVLGLGHTPSPSLQTLAQALQEVRFICGSKLLLKLAKPLILTSC